MAEQTNTYINSDRIVKSEVKGNNQVAIIGSKAAKKKGIPTYVDKKGKPLPTDEKGIPIDKPVWIEKAQTTDNINQAVNPQVKQLFTGQKEERVSGGVASKLAREGKNPQSIREDIDYTIYSPINTQSVQQEPVTFFENKKNVFSENNNSKKVYDVTPFIVQGLGKGYKATPQEKKDASELFLYPFTKQPLVQSYNEYGNQVSANPAGFNLFSSVLLTGGMGITSEPVVIKPGNVKTNIRYAVKSTASEDFVFTESKILPGSKVTFKVKGVSKSVSLSGGLSEEAFVTKNVGKSSGNPIIKTVGKGEVGFVGEDLSVSFSSVGQEVGGFGQKKVYSVLRGKAKQRSIADVSVESFATANSDDVVFGGSVGKQGSSFFTGKKMAESDLVLPGSPYFVQESTGLRSLTPTRELVIPDVNSRVSVFDVRSASQFEVPLSAKLTRVGVRQKMQSERNPLVFSVDKGFVTDAAREQISGSSSTGQVFKFSSPRVVTADRLVEEQVVKSFSETKPSLVVVPAKLSSKNDKVSAVSSVVSAPEVSYSFSVKQYGKVSSEPILSSSTYSFTTTESFSEVISGTSFKGIGKLGSRSGSRLVGKPLVDSLVSPVVTQRQVVGTRQIQMQELVTETVVTPKFDYVPSFFNPKVAPTTPGIVVPPLIFNENEGSSFSIFGRRRGKFFKIGESKDLSGAFKLGKSFVGNSAAATFKVLKGNQLVRPVGLGKGFYVSGGLAIEKPSFRIKSGGELREITFKGVAAQRNKRRKGLVGGLF